MSNFVQTENEEYFNLDYVVAIGRNSRMNNAFDVFMDDKEVIACVYVSEEECVKKLGVLLQEVAAKNRWVIFEKCGFAAKANKIKYIKNISGGIKFATDTGTWDLFLPNEFERDECKELLLGKRQQTQLDVFGLRRFL